MGGGGDEGGGQASHHHLKKGPPPPAPAAAATRAPLDDPPTTAPAFLFFCGEGRASSSSSFRRSTTIGLAAAPPCGCCFRLARRPPPAAAVESTHRVGHIRSVRQNHFRRGMFALLAVHSLQIIAGLDCHAVHAPPSADLAAFLRPLRGTRDLRTLPFSVPAFSAPGRRSSWPAASVPAARLQLSHVPPHLHGAQLKLD